MTLTKAQIQNTIDTLAAELIKPENKGDKEKLDALVKAIIDLQQKLKDAE